MQTIQKLKCKIYEEKGDIYLSIFLYIYIYNIMEMLHLFISRVKLTCKNKSKKESIALFCFKQDFSEM